MKAKIYFLTILILLCLKTFSQVYPTFGSEKAVTISGLNFDAMEPFISLDGNTLFFNSLNSGGNTNLYFATKINDTTFNWGGLVNGTYETSANHLDAVASVDSSNNFYWTSLRSIPNLYRGMYYNGQVNNISKVYGTCNILTPGWIIMDAAINYQGNLLYYSNGYFGPTYSECVGVPCKAILGIAQKINDSTFNKTSNSDTILSNINDTNYLIYAPQVTKDLLELYYTRLLKGGFNTEICVSVRNTVNERFSVPKVIYSSFGYFPEAASPTSDKQKLYYHKKDGNLKYSIYMRYRIEVSAINEQPISENFKVNPNPTNDVLNLSLPYPTENFTVSLYSLLGRELIQISNSNLIDISILPKGVYFMTVRSNTRLWTTKIIQN